MRRLEHLGPALVTLAAAGALLLSAPVIVRQLSRERTQVEMAAADGRLRAGTLLDALSQSTRDIATAVEPSVVHVSTAASPRQGRSPRMVLSTGSGWIYDLDGHIVTNAHVVDGARRIEIQLHDGERRDAELVGQDLRTDIAVLRADPAGLVPARRAEADPQQGEMVFAFGSPFDFRFSMSSGIVSGIGRAAGLQDIAYENYIQTDAAVNPGNSGGPLTNTRGDVVGMTTAIASGRGGTLGQSQFAGIGLAIPVSMIENVVGQLLDRGEVVKGFLGIGSTDVEPVRRGLEPASREARRAAELFRGEGVLVSHVSPQSPAEVAGLRRGDVITAVAGTRVAGSKQMRSRIAACQPGETIAIDLWRAPDVDEAEGTTLTLQATMGRFNPEQGAQHLSIALKAVGLTRLVSLAEAASPPPGLTVRRGVLVQEVAAGSLAETEVPVGSVIVRAFDAPVNNLDDLYARLDREVLRNQSRLDVPLDIIQPDGSTRQLKLGLRLP
jgi:serine protease Do